MNNEQIIEKIKNLLVEEFEVDEMVIQPEANLNTSLELDSLDYIDFVVVIESNFHFKVKREDFNGIVTFQDFYNYVIEKVNTKELA